MFNFFGNNTRANFPQNYFPITVDMHSHILPGIDDGSPTIETSLQLIEGLMALGIKRSIATPHIIGDMYRNDAATIGAALLQLQEALAQANINFEVTAAAEYMLDSYFFELLQSGQKLLTVKDNYLLTEFSYAAMPENREQMAFLIINDGYSPILAHPERYAYYHNNFNQFHQLAELGFKLQINLLSLCGYYGKETERAAHFIVKEGLASFAGTDLHHERHLQALTDKAGIKKMAIAFENGLVNEWL